MKNWGKTLIGSKKGENMENIKLTVNIYKEQRIEKMKKLNHILLN